MDDKKFNDIVAQAIDRLPEEFRNALDNVEVVIEDSPSNDQLSHFEEREGRKKGSSMLLLGLYQGVPLSKRGPHSYGGVLPDKITIFKKSIERYCGNDEKTMEEQIRRTVFHEMGHYFGLNDRRLRELGY